MDSFIKLIDTLAWPSTVIFLAYLFKYEVRVLLGRVSHLKYKELEAKFEKELTVAEEKAKSISNNSKENSEEEPIYPSPFDEKYYQLVRISEASPRAALIEAWLEVESTLIEVAQAHDIFTSPRITPGTLIGELIKKGVLPKTQLPLFHSLKNIRNEASHAPDFIPSDGVVKRYLELAIELSITLKKAIGKTS